MAETPAQRAARERNLRKGNPAAYKGGAQDERAEEGSQGGPGPAQGAAQGQTTFRARAPQRKKAAKAPKAPRAKRSSPRAGAQGAPGPAQGGAQDTTRERSGGFLGGLLEGFGG